MAEAIQELDAAGDSLQKSIERYFTACVSVQSHYRENLESPGLSTLILRRLVTEIPMVISHRIKIRRIESILTQTRNDSPTTTPLHALPSELLGRIFRIVTSARPCNIGSKDNSGQETSLPRYPDVLAQVCSRWRQITMGLPELWTHIDVAEFHSLTAGFVSRANASAARAGTLPLDIHIRIPASHDPLRDCLVLDFIASWATRIRTLELSTPRLEYQFDDIILDTFLSTCGTGFFTKLVIVEDGTYSPHFIGGGGGPDEDLETDDSYLSINHEQFEKVLLSVCTLRLDGVYPFWGSLAYHGLVELRLTCMATPCIHISTSQLHSILSHSPGLRVFQFGVYLIDDSPSENRARVVRLGDLCNLNLDCLSPMQLKTLLSLIEPGSASLQLTVGCRDVFLFHDEIVEFLERSNTTRLLLQGLNDHSPVERLIGLVPRLQVLVLSRIRQDLALDSIQFPHHIEDILPTSFRLDSLYLVNCRIPLESVCRTLKNHPVRQLFLWGSSLPHHGQSGAPSGETLAKLSALCPDVKSYFMHNTPNPVDSWDPLD